MSDGHECSWLCMPPQLHYDEEQAAPSPVRRDERPDPESDHLDALHDTREAYRQFHGYVLTCLWCPEFVRAETKREALALMQAHYDAVTNGKVGRLW